MRILAAAAAGVAMVMVGCGHQARPAPVPSQPEQTVADAVNRVVAAPVDPDPRVGAVFLSGSDLHACTGSVLHSAAGNLVLTAAHCLSPGAPARFVPGFAGSAAPSDVWTLDVLYLDPRWVADKDPLADYVIARVSRPAGGSVEALVGSALTLGRTRSGHPPGHRRRGIRPASAVVTDRLSGQHRNHPKRVFPRWPCAGLVDGTSGAPWISGSTVTGVIGGLHGGGCAENLSYSSPFDQHIAQLYARAQGGGPGDVPANDFGDEC